MEIMRRLLSKQDARCSMPERPPLAIIATCSPVRGSKEGEEKMTNAQQIGYLVDGGPDAAVEQRAPVKQKSGGHGSRMRGSAASW